MNQIWNSHIVIKNEDDKLQFKFNGSTFGVAINDGFEKDEVNSILEYMYEKDRIEREARSLLKQEHQTKDGKTATKTTAKINQEKIDKDAKFW